MSYDSTILADSPVAYWPLADTSGTTATDLVGANPGTYGGTFTLGQAPVYPGMDNGTLFDGGNTSQVSVPNSTALAITGSLSVECWVKIASGSGVTEFVTKPFTGHSNPFFNYALSSGRSGHFAFFVAVGSTLFEVNCNTAQATGVYYHIVGVYNGTDIRIYVNGVLDCTPVAVTGSLRNDAQPLYIGGPGNWTGENFPGTLWSVALYNSALTASQIAAHFTAASIACAAPGRRPTPLQPRLQGRWRRGMARGQVFASYGSAKFPDLAGGSYLASGTLDWTCTAFGPAIRPNDATGQGCVNLGTPIAAGATEFTLVALASTDTLTGGSAGLRHLWGAEGTPTDMRVAFQGGLLFFQVGGDGAFPVLQAMPPPLNVPVLITARLTTAGVRSIWYGPYKIAERTDSGAAYGSAGNALSLGGSVGALARNWSGPINAGYVLTRALTDAEIVALAADVFAPARPPRGSLMGFTPTAAIISAAASSSLTLTPTSASVVARPSAASSSFTLTPTDNAVHAYPVSAASSLILTPTDSATVAHTFSKSAASSFTLTPTDSSGLARLVAAATTLRFFPEPLAGFGWSVEGASSFVLTPTDDAFDIGPRRVSASTSVTFTPEATEEYVHAVLADAQTSFTLTFADSGSRKTLVFTPGAESTFTLTPAAGQNTDRHVAGASSLVFTPGSSVVFEAAPPQSRFVSADDRPTLIFNQLASTVILRHQFDELGRYRRGDKVTLGTSFPAIPDNPPIAVVLSLADSTIVGAYELAISDATRLDFALPVQVNLAYALGTYRVSYQFSVNGVPGTVRDAEFQVIPGGDSGGEVVSLHAFDRPESRYVVAQLNSGRLVQGRNPKVGDR